MAWLPFQKLIAVLFSVSMWPDLRIYRHFGKFLRSLATFSLWQNSQRFWQLFYFMKVLLFNLLMLVKYELQCIYFLILKALDVTSWVFKTVWYRSYVLLNLWRFFVFFSPASTTFLQTICSHFSVFSHNWSQILLTKDSIYQGFCTIG
jgi:hypothetical protein